MNDYVKPLVQRRMDFLEKEIEQRQSWHKDLTKDLEDNKRYVKELETELSELEDLQDTPRSKLLRK